MLLSLGCCKHNIVVQGGEKSKEEELQEERYPSVVPFLPPLTDKTMKFYLRFYLSAFAFIVVFGGLLAPTLEVKLGLGGQSRQCIAFSHCDCSDVCMEYCIHNIALHTRAAMALLHARFAMRPCHALCLPRAQLNTDSLHKTPELAGALAAR